MIEGKVAAVLNSRELVINRGERDGVTGGMKFEVLEATGHSVTDPDTGDPLGDIQRPKVRVKAVHVQDRLTIARTYETYRENIGGTGVLLPTTDTIARALTPPKYVTRARTLRTSEQTWEPMSEEESSVKRGDPVREFVDDDS